MRKKYLNVLFLLSAALLFSCSAFKTGGEKTVTTQRESKESMVQTSPFFKMFQNDLEEALKKSGKTLPDFIPSSDLKNKYGLRLFNGQYSFSGIATLNEEYAVKEAEKLGITTGRPLMNRRTMNVPLKSIYGFLQMQGIDYFDMNPPAELK